jgi:hypothetical protein
MHTVVSIYRGEQDSSKKSVWQSPFTSVLPLVESNVANKLSAAAESNSQRILATLAILNTYMEIRLQRTAPTAAPKEVKSASNIMLMVCSTGSLSYLFEFYKFINLYNY